MKRLTASRRNEAAERVRGAISHLQTARDWIEEPGVISAKERGDIAERLEEARILIGMALEDVQP